VNDRRRIIGKIKQLAEDPQMLGNNIIRLQGRPGFRLRIGDYRVIFEVSDTVLSVTDIDVRGNIY
jgi:mRNA interferase RelE/StbE